MKNFARRGIAIHEIDRGGDVTYHGPGQIVGYPILDLRGEFPGKKGPHLGAVEYVRWLEEALIRTCAEYGVLTQRIAGKTGVWTLPGGSIPEKKIAPSASTSRKPSPPTVLPGTSPPTCAIFA